MREVAPAYRLALLTALAFVAMATAPLLIISGTRCAGSRCS